MVDTAVRAKRTYQVIWEAVIKRVSLGDFRPVRIRMHHLSEARFKTVRKAFYKEKDLDKENNGNWRGRVEWILDRDGKKTDFIEFSAVPKHITDRT